MELSSLEIENFKSLKNVVLKFAPGLTMLCGKSQAGKSAALQAYELLAENKPSGTRFLHGRKKKGVVKVRANYDDRYAAEVRKKISGKTAKTEYSIYFEGEEVMGFKTVGRSVPQEVSTLINTGTPNIQRQSDDSFLVESSRGEISKEVSNFIGINAVQGALKSVSIEVNKNRSRSRYLREELEEAQEKIKKLEKIREVKMLYVIRERTKTKIGELEHEIKGLEEFLEIQPKLVAQIKKIEESSEEIGGLLQKYKNQSEEEKDTRKKLADLEVFISTDIDYKTVKAKFDKVRRKLMEIKVCPFCLSKVRKGQLRRILNAAD